MNLVKMIEEIAEEVLRELGPYYKEEVYEEALLHEFRLRGIPYERQRNIEILYKGYSVGMRKPDCILNPLWSGSKEEFLVEMKALAKIDKKHIMQAEVYLNSMNINNGVVLNFNTKTNSIDIQTVAKRWKAFSREVKRPLKEKRDEELRTVLNAAGREVLAYLGTEFFYHDKGEDIYIESIGVELRLNGVQFHSATYPILYKGHHVGDYEYNYIFQNGEVAKVFAYKKDVDIEEQIDELRMYNRIFGIKKGFILALPQNEGMDVVVKEV